MKTEKFKQLFLVLLLGIIGYVFQKTVCFLLVQKSFTSAYVYSIELLYLFFFFFSCSMILVLVRIKQNNINNVGYTFLLLTSIKMALAYLFLRPILSSDLPKTPSEKINFFAVFIYFLIIETLVTIRILNNKQ
jgi:hypothetical protein